ncbi:MAG: ABC transporter ATP-binding protein [Planctomycetota bacterium]|nr:ABC transporter ATP-binding protein [Planctomycetota bacterium]
MIRITDLRKAYGTHVAVDGVTFDIATTETFGLLGPNGAGKSTTIHMLVGALRPDSGQIEIDGIPDPTRKESRRVIGIAPQASALYEELTGYENLRFFARLYGLSGAKLTQRVRWSLEFVGLLDRAGDIVRHYSGGMKRRLNIAAAVIADPKVIMLDEPTVGVDPQSRNHMFDNIEQLKRDGKTIIYTTHYMEEAQRLCDRVAIMDHGRILAIDTVEELIARHGGHSVVEVELAPGNHPPAGLGPSLQVIPPGDNKRGGLEVDHGGTLLRIDTSTPDDEVTKLMQSRVRFTALQIHRPDLESVFLNLTGRRLRD